MYQSRIYAPRRPGPPVLPILLAVVAIAVIGGIVFQLTRALPAIDAQSTFPSSTVLGQAPTLPMPSTGAATVSVTGIGTLGTSNGEEARPLASVTKVMVAHLILKEHPLAAGESGPLIPVLPADVVRYQEMILQDQSALPVNTGIQFSQLDLLHGLLVPSANNFAEILARWDAGSVQAFVAKMNAEAQALGMTSTVYADVSGFSPSSVSTPEDQLILARIAMENPLFAQIVGMREVRINHIGTTFSTNTILGLDGVVGIKTGMTDEAGANLLFAARRDVGGMEVEIIGGVYGQRDRAAAFDTTRRLVNAVALSLQSSQVVQAGQQVGTFSVPWGDEIPLVAGQELALLLWPGTTLEATIEFDEIEAPLAEGSQVGWLNVRLGEQGGRVPVVLGADLPSAGTLWRLTRF